MAWHGLYVSSGGKVKESASPDEPHLGLGLCRSIREGMDVPQATQPTSPALAGSGGGGGQAGYSAAFGAGIHSQARA